MDSLKELYEKGEYSRLLEETEGKLDPTSLFYKISALLSLNRAQEALDALILNREGLFKAKPALTLKYDFELRFSLGQFEQAYQDLEFYRNAPYVSQEIEEALSSLPKRIREEEKAYLLQSVHKEEDLDALLESKDPYLALGALSQIGKDGIQGHEEALEKLLVSPSSPHDVKVFALEVLVAHDYPKEVTYLDMDSRVTLVPKDVENPFEERNALSLRKLLATLSDVSLASVCTQLLDQLALSCFPSYPFSGKPLSLESEALISLGREYLRQAQEEISEEAEQEKTRFKVLLSRYPRLP